MTPDNELLRHYAESRSEDAFAELVRRHVNLVYSAALRQVGGDAHLAQDVAQTVFTDLARKAASVSRRETLTGWLYTSTHFAAAKAVRGESRRRDREERFMREPTHEPAPDTDWQKLRPALDDAMHGLGETDREAVLLRYFENRAFVDVGAKLNLTENAARMRVERAVEKLRNLLTRRGITTAAALASVISANAIQVAPAGLASSLTASSLAAGTKAVTLAKIMAATKFKLALGTVAVGGAIAALVLQHHASETLRLENESLHRQVDQFQADTASNRLAAADDSAKLSAGELDELLKLRAEVTQLQASQNSSIAAATPLTNSAPDTTNTIINLRVKFVFLHTSDLQSLRPAFTPSAAGICVLSGQQSKFVDDAIQKMNYETDTAQITTRNGRHTRASVGLNSFPIAGTNASVQATLDVTPFHSPVSSLFNLSLMSLSYRLTKDSSRPDPQTIQTPTNQVTLFDEQTVAWQQDVSPGGWQPDQPETLLVFVTPAVVDATANSQAPQNVVSQEMAMEKMNDAKQGVQALLMFAWDNQNQFPTNLVQASDYLKDGSMEQIATNFDMLYSGPLSGLTNPAATIELREKQAWLSPAGTWMKSYGFADGHSELHTEPNGDFADYEKKHVIPPPN